MNKYDITSYKKTSFQFISEYLQDLGITVESYDDYVMVFNSCPLTDAGVLMTLNGYCTAMINIHGQKEFDCAYEHLKGVLLSFLGRIDFRVVLENGKEIYLK